MNLPYQHPMDYVITNAIVGTQLLDCCTNPMSHTPGGNSGISPFVVQARDSYSVRQLVLFDLASLSICNRLLRLSGFPAGRGRNPVTPVLSDEQQWHIEGLLETLVA